MTVDRDSEGPHLPLRLQIFESAPPLLAIGPLWVPGMKLLHIETLESQIFQTLFGRAHDVIAGKCLSDSNARGRGPDPVLRRHLRRHVNPSRRFTDHFADQFFAVSFAVA